MVSVEETFQLALRHAEDARRENKKRALVQHCLEAARSAPTDLLSCACLVEAAEASVGVSVTTLLGEAIDKSAHLPPALRGALFAWLARETPQAAASAKLINSAIDLLASGTPDELLLVLLARLATAAQTEGKIDEALAISQRALKFTMSTMWRSRFLSFQAAVEAHKGDLVNAALRLNEALSLMPTDHSLRAQRGRIALALGRLGEAASWLRPLDGAPDPHWAMALLLVGQAADAQHELERAIPCSMFEERVPLLVALALSHELQHHEQPAARARAEAEALLPHVDASRANADQALRDFVERRRRELGAEALRARSPDALEASCQIIGPPAAPSIHAPLPVALTLVKRVWLEVAPDDTHTSSVQVAAAQLSRDWQQVVSGAGSLLTAPSSTGALRVECLAKIARWHTDADQRVRRASECLDVLEHNANLAIEWSSLLSLIQVSRALHERGDARGLDFIERLSAVVRVQEVPARVLQRFRREHAALLAEVDPAAAVRILREWLRSADEEELSEWRVSVLKDIVSCATRAGHAAESDLAALELSAARRQALGAVEPGCEEIVVALEPYIHVVNEVVRLERVPAGVLRQIAPQIEALWTAGFLTSFINAQPPLNEILEAVAAYDDVTTFSGSLSPDARIDQVHTVLTDRVRGWKRNADAFDVVDDGTVTVWWD